MMSLPFVSLDGATSSGAGTARDLESVIRNHTMFVRIDGMPPGPGISATVYLDGSHDAVTWQGIAAFSSGGSGSGPVLGSVQANTYLVRYVRARLDLSAGTTVTGVTATIASGDE